jgi:hypothetical protein
VRPPVCGPDVPHTRALNSGKSQRTVADVAGVYAAAWVAPKLEDPLASAEDVSLPGAAAAACMEGWDGGAPAMDALLAKQREHVLA